MSVFVDRCVVLLFSFSISIPVSYGHLSYWFTLIYVRSFFLSLQKKQHRKFHVSTDLYQTPSGRLSPDFVRLTNVNFDAPDRFYARLPWDNSIPVPESFRALKLCDDAPLTVYFPFPNFMIDAGGIDEWLEWRRFTRDVNNINGSGLFLIDGATPPEEDIEPPFISNHPVRSSTEVFLSINCSAVHLLSIPDVVPPQRSVSAVVLPQRSSFAAAANVVSSCRCSTFDFGSVIASHISSNMISEFETRSAFWIRDILAAIGRRNFRDQRDQKEADTQRRLDDMAQEIRSRPVQAPLPVNPYVSPYFTPPAPVMPFASPNMLPSTFAPAPVASLPASPAVKRKPAKQIVSDTESADDEELDRAALKKEKFKLQSSLRKLGLFQ